MVKIVGRIFKWGEGLMEYPVFDQRVNQTFVYTLNLAYACMGCVCEGGVFSYQILAILCKPNEGHHSMKREIQVHNN